MKNLKELTDDELIAYYDELLIAEKNDYEIGSCGDIVSKYWEPIWREFDEEFKKRNL
jgi:hypothetical protein